MAILKNGNHAGDSLWGQLKSGVFYFVMFGFVLVVVGMKPSALKTLDKCFFLPMPQHQLIVFK